MADPVATGSPGSGGMAGAPGAGSGARAGDSPAALSASGGREPGGTPLAGVDISAGFPGLVGLQLDEVSSQRVAAHVDVGPQHLQPYGLVHGGVYATVAETLASIGAALAARSIDPGQGVVGLENHTSFLRAAREGDRIEAEALPRHSGRRVHNWVVSMRRASDGRELASSTIRLLTVAPDLS